jgi:zinc protease
VGDIDVDAIEAKIKALWANVPKRANYGERPLYTVNHNTAPLVAIVTDKEAQGSRITLEYKHDQLPAAMQNTAISYTQSLLIELICDMFNNRMTELALDPNASFTDAGCYYGEAAKLMDAFNAVYLPKEGKEIDAFNDLVYQVEKMRRYGFTNAELERVKNEQLNAMEKYFKERNTRKNIRLAQECIRHFEDGESMPGAQWEYEFVQATLPLIKVETINQIAAKLIHANPTVAISAPEKESVKLPSEQQILAALSAQEQLTIEAPKEEVFDSQLVKKAPRKGKIKEVTENKTLGTTEWMLSNGVKVVFKTTDFKADEILMQASSKGGESQVAIADLPSAQAATAIVQMSGVGEFSMTQLEKALTGKTASISPTIGKNTESMKGSSSVKDFETLLQLNYLYFTAPRRDEQAYNTVMGILSNQLANRDKNPKSAFSDSIQMMASNYSERTILSSQAMLDQINLDKALQIYKERFANPADFTFIFVGNINPNDPKVQALVCQWIGGLKTKKCYEDFIDHKETVVLGQQRNYFSRQMQTTTASNRIQYTSYDIPYTLANDLNMIMIGRILGTRYLESIREREGGSYGVGTAGGINFLPNAETILIMQFDTDPQKQERLMQIIHEEVQTIIKNGPLATDLQKEKESMLKDFQEDLEKNSYWRSQLHLHYLFGKATVNEYEQAVKGITAETVQDILKRLVDSKNMFEVVMFPEQ